MTKPCLFVLITLTPLWADSKYDVTPTSFKPGKEYTVTLVDPGCGQSPKKPVFASATDLPMFGAHPALKFANGPTSSDSCRFSLQVKVPDSTPVQTINLPLFRGQKNASGDLQPVEILDQVTFEIEGVAKGPIPPGVDPKGEVDLAYDVLPYRVTADNFGRRIAETYFAIQITVGNNSGYSLLLASIFFKPKTLGNNVLAMTPNTQYGAVRSTLEREQQVGRRAITVNIARGVLPMISSAGALVEAGAAADFAAAAGLYGLAEKVFELAYPDKTVRQLIALDTRTFRDGMIIKHNDQKPILLFIHREIVMCAKKGPVCTSCLPSAIATAPVQRLPFLTNFNPVDVKNMLGEVNLIGQKITFANRLLVTAIDESKVPVTPPATLFDVTSDLKIAQGKSDAIRVSGLNLASLTVSPPGGAKLTGVTLEAPKLSADGAAGSIAVSVAEDTKPDVYPIAVTAGGLTKSVFLTVASTKPKVDSVILTPSTVANNSEAQVKVTGTFLAGADIEPIETSEGLKFSGASCEKGSCKIAVKPSVKFAAADTQKVFEIKLQLVKAGDKIALDPLKLTVTK